MDKPDSSICIWIEHGQSKGHITFNMPEAICNTTKRKFKKNCVLYNLERLSG